MNLEEDVSKKIITTLSRYFKQNITDKKMVRLLKTYYTSDFFIGDIPVRVHHYITSEIYKNPANVMMLFWEDSIAVTCTYRVAKEVIGLLPAQEQFDESNLIQSRFYDYTIRQIVDGCLIHVISLPIDSVMLKLKEYKGQSDQTINLYDFIKN
tara:strand:- start:348 stop:806 length:459 start_codon:yes stop_codon:yes gene_type:complete